MRNEDNLCEAKVPSITEIMIGDSGHLKVTRAGDVEMDIGVSKESNGERVTVKDVLSVPDICANLMSVSAMAKHGNTLVFDKNCCRIFDEKSNLMATAPLVDDLYRLNSNVSREATAFAATISSDLWHRRMGHACATNLKRIKSSVIGMDFSNDFTDQCIVCMKGKQTRESFKHVGTRALEILQIIHTDVCGPMSTNPFGGSRYLLTFVDDFSRMVFIYPMCRKSDVFDLFVKFKTFVENQQNSSIKTLRSDNGTEFCNKQFDAFTSAFCINERHHIRPNRMVSLSG